MLKSFANGAVFGERYGDGPPTVLAIHGWAHTHIDYADVLKGVDSIAIDLPGFGASPPPATACSVSEWATMVAPVLKEFESPPVLVGHSVGGRIALHLALQNPELVKSLVLIAAPIARNPQAVKRKAPFKFRAAKKLHKVRIVSNSKMEALQKQYGSRDYRNASGIMRDILVKLVSSTDEEHLSQVKQHVDLVWARDDTETPIPIAENAVGLLPNAELTLFDSGGHLLPTTRPNDVKEVIVKASAR